MRINPGCVFPFKPYLPFQSCSLFDDLFLRGLAKQRKIGESETTPTVHEPEKTKPGSPVPHAKRAEAGEEAPVNDPQSYEPADDEMVAPMSPPRPILQTPNSPVGKGVTLTGAGYQSPSHVLTRHSGEAKENSPEKIDLAFCWGTKQEFQKFSYATHNIYPW